MTAATTADEAELALGFTAYCEGGVADGAIAVPVGVITVKGCGSGGAGCDVHQVDAEEVVEVVLPTSRCILVMVHVKAGLFESASHLQVRTDSSVPVSSCPYPPDSATG